jgi:Domain of unknown function (DUF4157)
MVPGKFSPGGPVAGGWVLSSPAEGVEQRADKQAEVMLRQLGDESGNAAGRGGDTSIRPLPALPAGSNAAEPALARNFGGGRPLTPALRAKIEPLLGYDLSTVRIYPHEADRVASEWHARAFTAGHSVFFRERDWQPQSREGLRLLLHELVHTTEPAQGAAIRRKPSVAGWEFHNQAGTTTAADNCCALCPANLGVDSHGYGPASFTNGMELKAFLNDEPGASYDIKRVRETSAWTRTSGTWSRFVHEGPGKPDDRSNDDECLTPQITVPYLPYIYSIDYPGVITAAPFGSATDIVYESNFIESVQITANAATFNDPKTFSWHAIVWVANSGSGWALDSSRSEIAPGSTTLGTATP